MLQGTEGKQGEAHALEARVRDVLADAAALSELTGALGEGAGLAELDDDGGDRQAAAVRAVGELFQTLWLERALDGTNAATMLQAAERNSGVPAAVLALEVLTNPGLLRLPPDLAEETYLELLAGMTGASHVSLWVADEIGRVSCRRRAGTIRAPAGARALVEELLGGNAPRLVVEGPLAATPVQRWNQPLAALVARAPQGQTGRLGALLPRAAEMLGVMLERQAIVSGGARVERAISSATERRLARLGLDLHDGPLQSVHAAGQALAFCRDQLERALRDDDERARVRGWMEDLEAQLVAIEAELRDFSASVGTPGVLGRPLAESFEAMLSVYGERTGARVTFRSSGDLQALTQSQQIALARIVQEGLNNAEAHSGATEVDVVVTADREGVAALVRDNGCGFDVDRTLVRATRTGRLGMLGMDERVRLLGGSFRVRSRKGGPTELIVHLPRWEADGAGSEKFERP